jgi:hypothetical protein
VTRHEDVNPRMLSVPLVVPGPGESLGGVTCNRTHGPWVCKPQPREPEHQLNHDLYNHVDISIIRDSTSNPTKTYLNGTVSKL